MSVTNARRACATWKDVSKQRLDRQWRLPYQARHHRSGSSSKRRHKVRTSAPSDDRCASINNIGRNWHVAKFTRTRRNGHNVARASHSPHVTYYVRRWSKFVGSFVHRGMFHAEVGVRGTYGYLGRDSSLHGDVTGKFWTRLTRRGFVNTRSVQKIRGLFELRGSSWFQENPLHVAGFVQISWLKRRFPVADIFICW